MGNSNSKSQKLLNQKAVYHTGELQHQMEHSAGSTFTSQSKINYTAGRSFAIAVGKYKFRALSNLDGDFDVPEEELDAVTAYIYQQIAS